MVDDVPDAEEVAFTLVSDKKYKKRAKPFPFYYVFF